MTPTVSVPAPRYPVSLAEVRQQLRIDSEDYDADLAAKIAVATGLVEIHIGRALITRSYVGFLDCWPCDTRGATQNFVALPRPPLISVESLTTFDDSDVATVMPSSQYFVDAASNTGRLVLRRGATWPIAQRTANGIQIAWTAGYGLYPSNVPETIRQAILVTVGVLNEQRGDESSAPALPPIAGLLLAPYLTWSTAS